MERPTLHGLKERFRPLSDEEYAEKVAVKATRKALKKLERKRGLPGRRKRTLKLSSEAKNASEGAISNMLTALVRHQGDVSDRSIYARGVDEESVHAATHDKLTGVLNRNGLEKYLQSADMDKIQGALYVDLTNFKGVNDNISHDRGDEVLKATSIILGADLRDGDRVARIGGDEFVVILCDTREDDSVKMSSKQVVDAVVERISTATHHYLLLQDNKDLNEVGFNIAVGGIEWEPKSTMDIVLGQAEEKMKQHKQDQHELLGRHR